MALFVCLPESLLWRAVTSEERGLDRNQGFGLQAMNIYMKDGLLFL